MADQSKVAQISEAIQTLVTLEDSIRAPPVNSLPNEVICNIFEFVKSDYLSSKGPGYEYDTHHQFFFTTTVQWTTVTHVCRRWREIALGNATLWTYPPMYFPTWALVMLQRSRSSPIQELDVDYDYVPDESITLAMNYMSRAKSLRFYPCRGKEAWEKVADKLLEIPDFPILENLEIIIWQGFRFNRASDWKNCLLPDHVLVNASSRLKKLKLSVIDINWCLLPLPSLTELQLFSISQSMRPTMSQLRQVLGGMPDLRWLRLVDALPKQTVNATEPDANTKKIVLGRLEFLTIGGTSFELKAFISSFASGSALAYLWLMVVDEGQDAHEDLLEGCQMALTEETPAFSNVRRVTVEAYNQGFQYWRFRILPGVHPKTEGPDKEDPSRERVLEITGSEYVPDSDGHHDTDPAKELRFEQLFYTVNWSVVDCLDLSLVKESYHAQVTSSQTFATTFGALTSIKEVVAEGWSVSMILDIFSRHGPAEVADSDDNSNTASEDSQVAPHPFSGLEQLHFKSVAFCKHDMIDHVIKFDDFVDALSARKKVSPVPSLILEDCVGLSQKDLHALSGVVGDVTVLPQPGKEKD